MPELPEVETVVRGLIKTILQKKIGRVICRDEKINQDNVRRWTDKIKNKIFIDIHRRGKNILIELSDHLTLWVHLKMTGHLYYLPAGQAIAKHDSVIFELVDDTCQLRFNDSRRFGRVRLRPTSEIPNLKGLAELGPEPLTIGEKEFIEIFHSRSRMIKPALLDQTVLAGLGNIYADESLFRSGIHPYQLTDSIPPNKLRKLRKNIRLILNKAIRLMGTSVDSYAGVDGRPGGYQKYLAVYGRENQPCPICRTRIKRIKIGSRSAHFCPRCQKSE